MQDNISTYSRGFTLIELLVTLMVAVLLLSVAIPGFDNLIKNNRLRSESERFFITLNKARQASMTFNHRAYVCRINNVNTNNYACLSNRANNWNNIGLLSYKGFPGASVIINDYDNQADNDSTMLQNLLDLGGTRLNNTEKTQILLSIDDGPSTGITVNSNVTTNVIGFGSDGSLLNSAPLIISICDDRNEDAGRFIEINRIGRIRTGSTANDGTAPNCTP